MVAAIGSMAVRAKKITPHRISSPGAHRSDRVVRGLKKCQFRRSREWKSIARPGSSPGDRRRADAGYLGSRQFSLIPLQNKKAATRGAAAFFVLWIDLIDSGFGHPVSHSQALADFAALAAGLLGF
jgi:hypothetical protein